MITLKTMQQRFTISEMAADWHELMIPWRIMQASVARDGNSLTRGAAHRHATAPISAPHYAFTPRPVSYYSFPIPLRIGG